MISSVFVLLFLRRQRPASRFGASHKKGTAFQGWLYYSPHGAGAEKPETPTDPHTLLSPQPRASDILPESLLSGLSKV
jgi:hypothetical protein